MKTGKATGPISIPTCILKLVKSIILKPLELKLNASFRTGIVPAKQANIVPVHKAGSQTYLNSYGPISLLLS